MVFGGGSGMFRKWLMAAAFLAAFSAPAPARGALEVKVEKSGSEQYERDVDQVALASQEKSIAKLSGLLKKYRATRQEPILLAKLAELQTQTAAIQFRIAHGMAHGGKKAIDLSAFKRTMSQAISTLNELIGKYPRYEEIALAYFMRGKAHEELGNVGKATEDYLHLVGNHPEADETIPAYMSLAGFAVDANDHARAVTYLNQVEKRPESAFYPFALYKLGWSHYNLKNIPTALAYVEKHVSYYNARATRSSDQALRENMLLDATVFFMEGMEQKLPQCQLAETLPYFKKLESGPLLGRMLLRYAKLLRSHGHEEELVAWKDTILMSEAARPESLDVVITTFEDQLNKRHYPRVIETARDMAKLFESGKPYESFPKAQKLLLDTADGLQALTVKNKGAEGVTLLSTTLASIYEAFTRIVDAADPRIPGVHYNLAETLFQIKEFESSAQNYRWVVERGDWAPAAKGPGPVRISAADASLKAIAARYEVLRLKQLIPVELAPRALLPGGAAEESKRTVDPLLAEWIEWVDTHVKKTRNAIDEFSFEAARALYAQGRMEQAIGRMTEFALAYPASRFAPAAAGLALDTRIASAQWEQTHELAVRLMKVEAWKKTEFFPKLFAAAADSFYKLMEAEYQARDFRGVLGRAEDFIKRYPASARLPDCLTLAGNAALSINDKATALRHFSRVIAESPKAASLGAVLQARAAIEEEQYRFRDAARDYEAYLALPAASQNDAAQLDRLRKKTLALAWLSADSAALRAALGAKTICLESLAAECDRYEALAALDTRKLDGAFEKARKGPEANRALWAALALEDAKSLGFRDRLLMVRQLASHWEELDGTVRFALIPAISVSIPKVFSLNRLAMGEVAPLRADEKYITHRVDSIREMENAATLAMKLPWARIRATVLNEIAGLYLDLARGLGALPPPKGLAGGELAAYEDLIRKLVLPFEEKGQELRGKSFELASRNPIEESGFRAVADPFFQDNPSQAKALKAVPVQAIPESSPMSLDYAALSRLDPASDWPALANALANSEDPRDPAGQLKARWAAALLAKRWAQVAFFLNEAAEKALVQAGALAAIKAVSLVTAGARAEGLAELEDNRRDLSPKARVEANWILYGSYSASYAREKAADVLKELESADPGLRGKIASAAGAAREPARTTHE